MASVSLCLGACIVLFEMAIEMLSTRASTTNAIKISYISISDLFALFFTGFSQDYGKEKSLSTAALLLSFDVALMAICMCSSSVGLFLNLFGLCIDGLAAGDSPCVLRRQHRWKGGWPHHDGTVRQRRTLDCRKLQVTVGVCVCVFIHLAFIHLASTRLSRLATDKT